ncbi:MAG: ribosome biogenesis GTPase A [Saprospiraceae bacterium]|jgi:ribosome biogenesis GTPase A|tara:strand:+ start:2411 stop:4141 length:1731 start_codon:yes stop_codon:yes gene_type:complete
MQESINPKLRLLAADTESAIKKLYELTTNIQNTDLSNTVKDILDRISAPFTFVIVGEVKAGKSSFVNALLQAGKDICKVAPSPMTDTIQLITYGEEEAVEHVNEHFTRITQPVDILKEIAIVDTPGTNSIVEHHQEITERFIPHSDLIVFVFEAKNPYRQSAWQFLDFINEEWRRKIIFVLQQKDLIDEADLAININGVLENANKKGIENPNVFAVSAKMELDGDLKDSGFIDIRRYIAENITDGKAPYLKLANNVNTSFTINEKIGHSLDLRIKQWKYDKEFRNEIRQTLDKQESKTQNQIDQLTENLVANYDRITALKTEELAEGLGFMSVMKRSFGSMFGSQESLKDWLEKQVKDFEQRLNSSLKEKLTNGIIDVADNIQTMGKLVHAKIKDSRTILKDSDEIFANIAEKRANVLMDLQKSFSTFLNESENFYDESIANSAGKVAPNLAAGSGIAVVGVILATITQGAVFDITGGILTTIGVLFTGVTLGLKKRKVLTGFNEEIKKGRTKLEWEVSEKLKDYTQRIKNKIDDNFYQLDLLLNHEDKTLKKLDELKTSINTDLTNIKQEVEKFI